MFNVNIYILPNKAFLNNYFLKLYYYFIGINDYKYYNSYETY